MTYVVWHLVEYRKEKRENDKEKQNKEKQRGRKEKEERSVTKKKRKEKQRGGEVYNPDSIDTTPTNNICGVTFMIARYRIGHAIWFYARMHRYIIRSPLFRVVFFLDVLPSFSYFFSSIVPITYIFRYFFIPYNVLPRSDLQHFRRMIIFIFLRIYSRDDFLF